MRHVRRPARAWFLLDQLSQQPARYREDMKITVGCSFAIFVCVRDFVKPLECREAPNLSVLPDGADGILGDERIGRHDRQPVNDRLPHQNSIERVAMQRWQPRDMERRFFVDAQR
jgi:hypothetical protein